MSKRRLKSILYLLIVKTQNVFLTSFLRYGCLKDDKGPKISGCDPVVTKTYNAPFF